MAYQLKTTGIAANCTMCIAVDPDTNTIKDFASASITSNMTVGANVTISEQAWDGNTRKFFVLGAGTTAADFVEFGAAARPQWDFNAGESRTWVFIGEAAGNSIRVMGGSDSAYMASRSVISGGNTFPQTTLGGASNGGGTPPTAGQRWIFGHSLVHNTSNTFYRALHDAASMTTGAATAVLAPGGTTFDFAIQFIGRLNTSTVKQQDKIHAVLIFNTALTQAQWDSLRDDWFTVLLESDGGGGAPAITDEPDNTTVTAGATASFSATYTGSIAGYQWQQSTDGGGTWGSVPDGTGASGGAGSGGTLTYTTTATAVSTGNHRNTYRYRLQLDPSGAPVNSAAAILTVNAAPTGPTINTQPSNATVTEPTAASFTVAATASGGSLSYQWQVSTNSGGSWANVSDGTGATTASYTTSGTAVSTGNHRNGYQYRCAVTDSNGTTNSNAATLTVNASGSGNNIRLQPALDLDRGGDAASRTINRWWVLSADLTAILYTGTGATTNVSGQPTIDINGTTYAVGDNVPMWFGEWTSETNPLDRTVRSGLMWVPAIAQA